MPVGVSTACFYPEETEKALQYCGQMGTPVTEVFFNAPSELEDSFIKELIRIKQYYGIKIAAVHPFTSAAEPYMLFSGYKRRFMDGRELYKRYAEAAQKLGAGFVVLHGDRSAYPGISLKEYVDRFLDIDGDLSAYSISLTQENVSAFRAASPEVIGEIRRYSGDRVWFTFDVKQAVRAGYSPQAIVEAMGHRVAHVHISDHADSGDCLLPTTGTFAFGQFFDFMRGQNYTGDYVIELYRSAFKNIEDLSNSRRKVEEIFHYTICK